MKFLFAIALFFTFPVTVLAGTLAGYSYSLDGNVTFDPSVCTTTYNVLIYDGSGTFVSNQGPYTCGVQSAINFKGLGFGPTDNWGWVSIDTTDTITISFCELNSKDACTGSFTTMDADISTLEFIAGCSDGSKYNYDPLVTYDDGSCSEFIYGCTDPSAQNYDPSANADDFSCFYLTNLSATSTLLYGDIIGLGTGLLIMVGIIMWILIYFFMKEK